MKKVTIVVLVFLVVLCGGGYYALNQFRSAAAKAAAGKIPANVKVEKGDLVVQVVESGTVDAIKSVEVKSRVQGRLAKLYVDEGMVVKAGDLIGIVDPQETELRVEQDKAQLRGAQSGVNRARLEIEQRKVTSRAAYERALARVAQVRKELAAQPTLTRTAIESAQTAYNTALQARDQLLRTTQPNDRTAASSAVAEATSTFLNSEREQKRRAELLKLGYVSEREAEDARLQLELARTRLDSAKERMARIDLQQRLERQQADERVKQAKSDLDRANANSMQDELKAQELRSAIASLRDAEAGLKDVAVAEMSLAQSQASVDQISTSVRDSERQLGETEIRAPIGGIVAKRLIQEGELVSSLSSFSSGTPIVRIENRDAMLIKLDVNEIDVARLSIGTESTVEVDAIPNKPFKGRVSKIAPTSRAAVQGSQDPVVKYEVEIRVDERDERLKSGMTAKCTMVTLRRPDALKVPLEYLGKDDKGYFLAVVKKPGAKPETVRVKVGARTGSQAEILDGASVGQEIAKPAYKGPARRGAFGAEVQVD